MTLDEFVATLPGHHAARTELASMRARLAAQDNGRAWKALFEKLRDSLRYLECPCCGDEGAFPTLYEDGDPTVCGCGGTIKADGEEAYISIDDEDCPKCNPK
jgi:hypothetical protein